MDAVPRLRVRAINDDAPSLRGDHVLYWMTAYRRGQYNFALQRAVGWARELGKPLVVLEPLRCDYPWASDRLHRFVIEGMVDNANWFRDKPVHYFPYLETKPGDGKGLVRSLAGKACVVVGDDFPAFFLPRMTKAAASQIPARFELVDANGLLPMRATDRVFSRAFDFRRFLHRTLPAHLADFPRADPLAGVTLPALKRLPSTIRDRWPPAHPARLVRTEDALNAFPIDHSVSPTETRGGVLAAKSALDTFLDDRLELYATERNQPEREATSGLSPYLHFGHMGVHQVFEEVTRRAEWTPNIISAEATGKASGWWGATAEVEGFVDQLVTWRELGFNMCSQRHDFDKYESLPSWARRTLAEHEEDPRPHLYALDEFAAGRTHDRLWNAAQRQLAREGRIHNYIRMLWGKKILEWSASPRHALDIMVELNNKYALDGRDPNSYSGIFWVLGRYDRAWGPERSVFGKIRYMSSENTSRKVRIRGYISKYAQRNEPTGP